MEKELAIEQERTRLAMELHDGLGSMLSGIKHSFSAIKNQLDLNETQEAISMSILTNSMNLSGNPYHIS